MQRGSAHRLHEGAQNSGRNDSTRSMERTLAAWTTWTIDTLEKRSWQQVFGRALGGRFFLGRARCTVRRVLRCEEDTGRAASSETGAPQLLAQKHENASRHTAGWVLKCMLCGLQYDGVRCWGLDSNQHGASKLMAPMSDGQVSKPL